MRAFSTPPRTPLVSGCFTKPNLLLCRICLDVAFHFRTRSIADFCADVYSRLQWPLLRSRAGGAGVMLSPRGGCKRHWDSLIGIKLVGSTRRKLLVVIAVR